MRNLVASEVLSFLGGNPSSSRRSFRGSFAACSLLGSRAHLSVGSAVRSQEPPPAICLGKGCREWVFKRLQGAPQPDGGSELAFAFHRRSTLFIFLPSPQFREFTDCPGFPNSEKLQVGSSHTDGKHQHQVTLPKTVYCLALGTMDETGMGEKGRRWQRGPIPSLPHPPASKPRGLAGYCRRLGLVM